MLLTSLLAIIMLGLFLLLWAGVGFIQNKNFFSSYPKEVFDLIQAKEKRFYGQYLFGWLPAFIAIVLMIGAMVFGVVNGIQNSFTFMQFFTRFLIMLLLLKTFDIIFFDWVLLQIEALDFLSVIIPK